MKVSSLAEPILALFMYIELPRILMSLLSTPLSMRVFLSLSSIDSILHSESAADIKGLMYTFGVWI